ncbi:MAG: IPT/TIG domain-containing protein [Blastocatellia bacterium]
MSTIRGIQSLRNRTNFKTRILYFTAILLALAALLDLAERIFVPGGARGAAIIQNSVPVATTSAASFVGLPAAVAKNSIVAAFGTQLATGVQIASTQPLPTTLLTTSVTVNGTPSPLFFVSPNQVNYLIPPNTPDGDVQVVITSIAANGDQIESRGQIKIASSAPAIFTAGSTGAGAPAALTGRVINNQFVFDSTTPFEPDPLRPGQFLPAPIDVGVAGNPGFLILYCTGALNAPAGSVKAVIGGVEVAVSPVVAPGFTGLDQINLELPVSLKGSGIVELRIVVNGVSSNPVSVNLAGNPGAGVNISSFSVTDGAIAGQTITINGAGFSTDASQNLVRFGAAQGQVVGATATQMTVIVPFNAESGQVMLQTPQGETRSSSPFKVRTSISGIVQSTGSSSSPPVPLEGVTIRIVGKNISVRTNPQGTFVIPNLNPGVEQIEIDGGTTGVNPPYPRITVKATIQVDRDNQFAQPVSMQQIVGGSGGVSGGAGFAGDNQSSAIGLRVFEALKRQQEPGAGQQLPDAGQQMMDANQRQMAPGLLTQVPAKSVVISHRGVTLEIPIGTGVKFPDGKSNGQVQLTVLEKSRLPGISLPAGIYSSNIAQITPYGVQFSPGASMSFPNPDQSRLGPGAKVDLYRYDFRAGAFIKRGTATVTADRARVVSDGRPVDLGSYWLAAAPAGVTTVNGRVINAAGFPVAGAQVSVNGRSDTSDQNGGFSIAEVATAGVSQVQAEAVLPRQWGTSPRGMSALTNVVAGGVTNVGSIALSNTNQLGLVLSPFLINFESGSPPVKLDVTLTQPAPSNGLTVTLASSDIQVATVTPANVTIPGGRTTASVNVTRVEPGVALITARATVVATALETVAVITVAQPAPRLAGVSPASAPAGAKITITGSGLSPIADGNIVGFVRNGALVAILDPTDNEIIVDATGRPALRVEVPDIVPGAAQIVAATIDGLTGVISDTSAPINFTVARADLNAPALASVTPAQGKPRDQITINGSGFSPVATENRVIFRQGFLESQARVVRSSANQLFVEVPSLNISRGPATILVRRVLQTGGKGGLSNALDFTITADPVAPARPTLATANVVGGGPRGRDGDPILVTGTGLGRNFYDVKTDDVANDEPLVSILFFYQNNQLVNFALPVSATGGTQITSVIPAGLNAGAIQITTLTFDLESGLISDESNPVNFSITVASLRRIDEDEPNDGIELATEVTLQTIVDGRAAKDDPGDFFVTFNDGTSETLVDLFLLSLDKPTTLTLTLTFNQSADLDLFVMREAANGEFEIVSGSTRKQGTIEQLGGSIPAGDYYIAVGAFSGTSSYALELRQGVVTTPSLIAPDPFNIRHPVLVERRKKRE